MALRRHWRQSVFDSLKEKQNIAAADIAKILTLCLNIQLKTDVEIRFAFDGADHHLHISFICLPKRGDPHIKRDGEEVVIVDDIKFDTKDVIRQLQYILENRTRG